MGADAYKGSVPIKRNERIMLLDQDGKDTVKAKVTQVMAIMFVYDVGKFYYTGTCHYKDEGVTWRKL